MTTAKTTSYNLSAKQSPLEGFKTFGNQVAGHLEVESKPCFLLDDSGHVLKMVDTTKATGITETAFFEKIFGKRKNGEEELEILKKFLPRYYGLLQVNLKGENLYYLKLENLLNGYTKPSIIDIKIGRSTADPFADDDKVERAASKYQFQTQLGFRVLGFKSFRSQTGRTEFCDKKHCKLLAPEQIIPKLMYFLDLNHVPERIHLVDVIIKKLKELLGWFSHQKIVEFYSSSILIAFDGQRTNYESTKMMQKKETIKSICKEDVVMRMIDFPHTYFGLDDESLDTNYIYGLENLISFFERLRTQFYDFK